MSSLLWQGSVARHAEQVIKGLGITTLPVCPISIANELNISVEPLPSNSQGVSGMLLRHGNEFGILYSTFINNEGFQRFCIAHELGHYCLPGHPEGVLLDGVHASQAGFISKNQYELEADYFATSLLMPSKLFNAALNNSGQGLNAIELLAQLCVTSLTSTAIRYAQNSPDAVAIIVSTENIIDYCFMSEALRNLQGLDWLKKSSRIPKNTVTYEFNQDQNNVFFSRRKDGDTNIQIWFGGGLEVEMREEVLGLGNYGKTLTVLSSSYLPDDEELEEEEELIDSWTPRFHR